MLFYVLHVFKGNYAILFKINKYHIEMDEYFEKKKKDAKFLFKKKKKTDFRVSL